MVTYNSDITTARRNRFAQHQNLLNSIANRRLGFNNAYAAGKNKLDYMKPESLRQVGNADASRGMIYSSVTLRMFKVWKMITLNLLLI
jgi:hypothetical protein